MLQDWHQHQCKAYQWNTSGVQATLNLNIPNMSKSGFKEKVKIRDAYSSVKKKKKNTKKQQQWKYQPRSLPLFKICWLVCIACVFFIRCLVWVSKYDLWKILFVEWIISMTRELPVFRRGGNFQFTMNITCCREKSISLCLKAIHQTGWHLFFLLLNSTFLSY